MYKLFIANSKTEKLLKKYISLKSEIKNKLNKLNYKLYDYIISDFKFRDIFILLYNNESI